MKRWPGTGRSRRRTEIRERRLIFKRDDTKPHTTDRRLQKAINASLNQVRIEDLLLEVDRLTGFSRHFVPLQRHQARPPDYYKTLLAAIISQDHIPSH